MITLWRWIFKYIRVCEAQGLLTLHSNCCFSAHSFNINFPFYSLKTWLIPLFFLLFCDSFLSVGYLYFSPFFLLVLSLPLYFLLSPLYLSPPPTFIFISFFSCFWLMLRIQRRENEAKSDWHTTVVHIKGLVYINNYYILISLFVS